MRRLANRLVDWLIAPTLHAKTNYIWEFRDGSVQMSRQYRSKSEGLRERFMLVVIRHRVGILAFDGLCRLAGRPTYTETIERRDV